MDMLEKLKEDQWYIRSPVNWRESEIGEGHGGQAILLKGENSKMKSER